MNSRTNPAFIAAVQGGWSLFVVCYLWDKYDAILEPSYTGTCYQTRKYLAAYMGGIVLSLAVIGAISLVMALKFIGARPRNFAVVLLVASLVSTLIIIKLTVLGSC